MAVAARSAVAVVVRSVMAVRSVVTVRSVVAVHSVLAIRSVLAIHSVVAIRSVVAFRHFFWIFLEDAAQSIIKHLWTAALLIFFGGWYKKQQCRPDPSMEPYNFKISRNLPKEFSYISPIFIVKKIFFYYIKCKYFKML